MEVLEQARDEMTDWRGSGMSVMEISHRSKAFLAVAAEAEADLRELLAIPGDYKVLFMQGGATGQFSAIPMNLARAEASVDYVNTGSWSKKALGEARRYSQGLRRARRCGLRLYHGAAARRVGTHARKNLHHTPNETKSPGGVDLPFVPQVHRPPVADTSSTILSRPIDVSRFGLIYAGARSNIGPSGPGAAIVRGELLGLTREGTPSVWNYKAMADEDSMLNTQPTSNLFA